VQSGVRRIGHLPIFVYNYQINLIFVEVPVSILKSFKLVPLLALVLALLLAACGGDDDQESAPPTSPPEVTAGIAVGAPAPDFALPASDGSTVSLADYKGQPVLLFFHMADG
jgi:hypothetical protein